MGESTNYHQQPLMTSSRLATRGRLGEIMEVQGGHIVRSIGRKDRHTKVCTAKGPRDRRVRLSAHTAIQFYDVQDRLGYDRPSKAIDWLIENAKSAINELTKLPTRNPTTVNQNAQQEQEGEQNQLVNENINENESQIGVYCVATEDEIASGAGETSTLVGSSAQTLEQLGEDSNSDGSGFFPPSLGTDITNSIKSFFPIGAIAAPRAKSSTFHFENYSPYLVSRTSIVAPYQNQDLQVSLKSFQDHILLHRAQTHRQCQQSEQLLSATIPLGFDRALFPNEHSQLHRMATWNGVVDTNNVGHDRGEGFIFNSPSPMPTLSPLLFSQSQYFTQKGPLQSSTNPSICAWIDSSTTEHQHHLPTTTHHQSSMGTGGFRFNSSDFSGFLIPALIGGEEEQDGVIDKPSSASSDSRY